jgi:AcrR family transcriptional regulator
VARGAGTTTRAIYSLFSSKDGLVVALGERAFTLLQREIEALPNSDRPADDLVEAALVFRRFALEHPALFSIAFHRADPAVWPRFRVSALAALAALDRRFEPLADAGLLGGRSIPEASTQFRALGEGVAWTELRGNPLPPDPERFWRNAFHALIAGFAAAAAPRPRRRAARARKP